MTYNDLENHYWRQELLPVQVESIIARQVLETFSKKRTAGTPIPFPDNQFKPVSKLLRTYEQVKGTENLPILEEILREYKFDDTMAIHCATSHLLDKNSPLSKRLALTKTRPGIKEVRQEKDQYTLETSKGTIRLFQAHRLWTDPETKQVFQRRLQGRCYERTDEFVEAHPDYKVVFSYMPNFFGDGHYHVFAARDEETIDLATNAYYPTREDCNSLLYGDVIAEKSIGELNELYDYLSTVKMPEILVKRPEKLRVLCMYLDYERPYSKQKK